MYIPIISPSDLSTHLYAEIAEEITRGDNTVATQSITEAIEEVKAYLSKYDLKAMFGSVADATAPTYTDNFIKSIVKDVAIWHYINLANPNINYENARTRYQDAIKKLEKIMRGEMTPQGWPFYIPPSNDPTPGNAVWWGSTTKRDTHL